MPSGDCFSDNETLIRQLREIVGARNVLTDRSRSLHYRRGYRSGEGEALAVVFPESLLAQWQVLQLVVASGKAIVMQAANTGLTEGSTPHGGVDEYGREVIVINTLRMDTIRVIAQGRQVVCFPGATLHRLENVLKPYGREPHSEIGSSCIGASVIGGVCNNSGGMLVRRGPAYTEMALFARLDTDGVLHLVNHLGIRLGDSPEEILTRLESGDYAEGDIDHENARHASCADYETRLRDLHAPTPARFNADPERLYEASGSAGKLAVFAVRLDTFPRPEQTAVFCIGAHDAASLTALRQRLLANGFELPVACEYMHREIFDLSAQYAKDSFVLIDRFGTDIMPRVFAWKSKIDRWCARIGFLPARSADHFAHWLAQRFPEHLPVRWRELRSQHEYLVLLKVSGQGIEQTQALLNDLFTDAARGKWFMCSEREGEQVFLHRFVAGGAPMRYGIIHHEAVEGVISLDFALPRNTEDWDEALPSEISEQLAGYYRYGHFLCHVFHYDYIVRKGRDMAAVKQALLDFIAGKGGEYPAEHNVGHVYPAKPALADFYRASDPTNTFNPGVGRMSKRRFYG